MVLEATMIIIDNSEYMRNGDYTPTRFAAQSDAVNVISQTKTGANPENTVGLMTMAGKNPQVLATLTTDLGKILSGLYNTQMSNESDLSTSLQVAQLALKHRQNKNQRQRIVAFVGSPLKPKADEKALVKLAKKLKKNNVAVDIVSFGEDEMEENESVLKAFVEGVQSGDNSHLVCVPTGHHLLSEAIVSSPIIAGEESAAGGFSTEASGSGGGGGESFAFGVDPSLDPELAMALRMSLEEERARQAATAPLAPSAQAAAAGTLPSVPEVAAPSAPAPVNLMDEDAEDEELAKALLLSQQGASEGDEDVEMSDDRGDDKGNLGDEEMSEEDAIARAIEMSMNEDEEKPDEKKK